MGLACDPRWKPPTLIEKGRGPKKYGTVTSLFRCYCGKEFYAIYSQVTSLRQKSCGCLTALNAKQVHEKNTKHKMCGSTEYRIWASMKDRCDNPNANRYDRYGGRGITYSRSWRSFENFYRDMGPRPTRKHTLDRVDNDGNYTKSNCRWATGSQQANNTHRTKYYTYKGKRYSLHELSLISPVCKNALKNRLEDRKIPVDHAMEIPSGKRHLLNYLKSVNRSTWRDKCQN